MNRKQAVNKMRRWVVMVLVVLVSSCISKQETPQDMAGEARETLIKEQETSDAKESKWNSLVDSLNKIADTNQILALEKINHLLDYNIDLDRFEKSELHLIKGQIYYRIDSFRNAVEEFTFTTESFKEGTPDMLEARAGAYIKLKQFDNAFFDLVAASKENYEYLWSLGNYYEIINNKDSAIACYNRFYLRDSINCKECIERINVIKKANPKLLTELKFRRRERGILQLKLK